MSWTGRAAAAGAPDGKIVDSELAEVLIGDCSLSVRGLGTPELTSGELYHNFFSSHVNNRNILALMGRKLLLQERRTLDDPVKDRGWGRRFSIS
jgi:hypothetical protein